MNYTNIPTVYYSLKNLSFIILHTLKIKYTMKLIFISYKTLDDVNRINFFHEKKVMLQN